MSNGKNLTKRLIKKRIMTAFEWKTFFCLESHIHLCSRHTSANPAYVIKTCVTWHAISGTRYWGFVSPKLHVSTYRNQQHCWWFHKSLESGVFEQDWKNARVTPIYKDDGDINDENYYRPISAIGHIAEMIESLVSYQIIDFLEDPSFISMDQSAYLKRHSTQTSLHHVIDDWLENVNDGAITGACLLDISKCFDSINHTILLKKLEMYGITSTEQKWFSSYLRGRKQIVKFHQETSEFCDITCGVP